MPLPRARELHHVGEDCRSRERGVQAVQGRPAIRRGSARFSVQEGMAFFIEREEVGGTEVMAGPLPSPARQRRIEVVEELTRLRGPGSSSNAVAARSRPSPPPPLPRSGSEDRAGGRRGRRLLSRPPHRWVAAGGVGPGHSTDPSHPSSIDERIGSAPLSSYASSPTATTQLLLSRAWWGNLPRAHASRGIRLRRRLEKMRPYSGVDIVDSFLENG
ncbi:unnamed protein product, partial [Urochloa humidicola]